MEIKIIKGTYGQRTVNPATKAVRVRPVSMGERAEVDHQEAARLVALGIAAYLDEKPQDNPAGDADSPGKGENGDGAGKHLLRGKRLRRRKATKSRSTAPT